MTSPSSAQGPSSDQIQIMRMIYMLLTVSEYSTKFRPPQKDQNGKDYRSPSFSEELADEFGTKNVKEASPLFKKIEVAVNDLNSGFWTEMELLRANDDSICDRLEHGKSADWALHPLQFRKIIFDHFGIVDLTVFKNESEEPKEKEKKNIVAQKLSNAQVQEKIAWHCDNVCIQLRKT